MLFHMTSITPGTLRHLYSSPTLVMRCDSVLKEIFPPGNYKLYFRQKLLLKLASDM